MNPQKEIVCYSDATLFSSRVHHRAHALNTLGTSQRPSHNLRLRTAPLHNYKDRAWEGRQGSMISHTLRPLPYTVLEKNVNGQFSIQGLLTDFSFRHFGIILAHFDNPYLQSMYQPILFHFLTMKKWSPEPPQQKPQAVRSV